MKRLIVGLKGAVQGVGFRPFVYRLASGLGLKGYVLNDNRGVTIEVEGSKESLDQFLLKLHKEKPSIAHIFSEEITYKKLKGYKSFEVRKSRDCLSKEVLILPDIATCELCLKELYDPKDRRHNYPFINCTLCGPRFTIVKRLPYDRPNTSMEMFNMCAMCQKEYDEPSDRRFHAQPNACPVCGPDANLHKRDVGLVAKGNDAIFMLIQAIKEGKIAAIKGLGGFHLIMDARNEESISRLRAKKGRQEKPFAVMFPSMGSIRECVHLSSLEEALILSPQCPIVLVKKRKYLPFGHSIATLIAPGLNSIGVFLPYAPLHHIIINELGFPLVATSANLFGEPIVIQNEEAFEKLFHFCDFILTHNRPILRRCDDSVMKVVAGFPLPIRRSRGYAPLAIKLSFKLKRRVLATGGLLKNAFSIGFDDKVILSQHIGDLETLEALGYFDEAVHDLCALYDFIPEIIVHDLHPGYSTSKWALSQVGVKKVAMQHHFAHILSCMAENGLKGEVLGIAWDGTGYGNDGTVWGGEFLTCTYIRFKRIATFRPLKLIGGELAIKEPRRVALSILFEMFGVQCLGMDVPTIKSFMPSELEVIYKAWQKNINTPFSSSAGRLIDALASLLGVCQFNNYEGQAAMMLEELYQPSIKNVYPYYIENGVIDWAPMFEAVLIGSSTQKIVSMFINTLAEIVLTIARDVRLKNVCLSGGVFQNDPLTRKVMDLLTKDFDVFSQTNTPPNDGGLALGQAVYGGLV